MCQQTLRLLARYRIPALLLAEHNRGPRHSFAVVDEAIKPHREMSNGHFEE